MSDADGETVHGTCVVVGPDGVLIRGPSGSGKSLTAHRLITYVNRTGGAAALVCDDRVRLAAEDGRLIAHAVPAIAGRIELRGLGLIRVPFAAAAPVSLVLDLGEGVRLPDPEALWVRLAGTRVRRVTAPAVVADPAYILAALAYLLRNDDDPADTFPPF